jgi:ketosteroid isomerase-like protein
VVTVGDLAYLSNTWSLSGTGPDGNPVNSARMVGQLRRLSDHAAAVVVASW